MAQSVTVAPGMILYRAGIAAVDTLPEANQKLGVNFGHYETAHVNVIPSGGADPDVEVLYWSDAAGAFIREHVALTKAGVGADTPFSFTFPVGGRIAFIAVTTLAGGAVDIEVAGYNLDHTL